MSRLMRFCGWTRDGPFDAEGIFHHLDTSEEVNFDILKGPAFAFEQRDSCLDGMLNFIKNTNETRRKGLTRISALSISHSLRSRS